MGEGAHQCTGCNNIGNWKSQGEYIKCPSCDMVYTFKQFSKLPWLTICQIRRLEKHPETHKKTPYNII